MKTIIKKDKIKTIIGNPANRLFFKATSVFGDKAYNIVEFLGKDYFAVVKRSGIAYYELKGTRIGNFTNLFNN